MILTEESLTKMILTGEQESNINQLKLIYLNGFEINDIIFQTSLIYRIEFLSLQNNNLKNISFIKNLNNLWYLDLRKNPIENFSAFEVKKSFGFLGISIEKISEKAICEVKNLQIGILFIKADSKIIENKFMENNPIVFRKNQEIHFPFIEKYLNFEENIDLSMNEIENLFEKNKFLWLKNFLEKVFKLKIKIIKKLEDGNEFKESFDFEKIKRKEFDKVENTNLINILLELEKINLVFYKKLLESFIFLNKNKNEIFNKDYRNYFINPISSLLSNKIIEEKKFFFDINFLRSPNILNQLALIVIIPLQFLNILSKEITSNIIIYLLKRTNNVNNQRNSILKKIENDISRLFELDYSLKFGIFYDLINKFKRHFSIFNTQNKSEEFLPHENSNGKTFITKEKIESIINFLDNIFLLRKLKILQEKKHFFETENSDAISNSTNNLLELIKDDMNLISEVFILTQLLKEILITLNYKKKPIVIVNQNLMLRKNEFEFFVEIDNFVYENLMQEIKKITNVQSSFLFFELFDYLFENPEKILTSLYEKEILNEKIKEMKFINFFELNNFSFEENENRYKLNEKNKMLRNLYIPEEKEFNLNKTNNTSEENTNWECKININKLNSEKLDELNEHEKSNKRIIFSKNVIIKPGKNSSLHEDNINQNLYQENKLNIITNYGSNYNLNYNNSDLTTPLKRGKISNTKSFSIKDYRTRGDFDWPNKSDSNYLPEIPRSTQNGNFKFNNKDYFNKNSTYKGFNKTKPVIKNSTILETLNENLDVNKNKNKKHKNNEIIKTNLTNTNNTKLNFAKKEKIILSSTEKDFNYLVDNENNENEDFISSNKNNFKLPDFLHTDNNLNLTNKFNNFNITKTNINIQPIININTNTNFNFNATATETQNNDNNFIQIINKYESTFNNEKWNDMRENTNEIFSKTKKKNKTKQEITNEEKKIKYLLLNQNQNTNEKEAINNSKEISSFIETGRSRDKKATKLVKTNSNLNNNTNNNFKIFSNLDEFKDTLNVIYNERNSIDLNYKSTQMKFMNNYLRESRENYWTSTSSKLNEKNFQKIIAKSKISVTEKINKKAKVKSRVKNLIEIVDNSTYLKSEKNEIGVGTNNTTRDYDAKKYNETQSSVKQKKIVNFF